MRQDSAPPWQSPPVSHDERPAAVPDDPDYHRHDPDAVDDVRIDRDESVHRDEQYRADEPAARDDYQPSGHVGTGEVPVAEPADETAVDEEPTELKPGDVPVHAVAGLWTTDTAQGFRDRWRDAQLRFVDDPRGVAEDVKGLVDEAVEALTSALAGQRAELDNWHTDGNDTEQYRVVVQRYRAFFERLLTL